MQCFMKKVDKGLIDVKHIELASFLLQFCLIHLSLASLAFCATYITFLTGICSLFNLSALSASTSLRLFRAD